MLHHKLYWNFELWRIMGKEKKCTNEIRRFDCIVLIARYWLVYNNWLAVINWPDHLTCSSYSVRRKTPWEYLVNKGSNFTHSTTCVAPYGRQWVKMCHIFCEQVIITLVTFICAWVLISFKTFMWTVIGDECLFQQPPYYLFL